MTTGETIYLAIVLATFFGFMAMLATHSIQYQRDRDRTER